MRAPGSRELPGRDARGGCRGGGRARQDHRVRRRDAHRAARADRSVGRFRAVAPRAAEPGLCAVVTEYRAEPGAGHGRAVRLVASDHQCHLHVTATAGLVRIQRTASGSRRPGKNLMYRITTWPFMKSGNSRVERSALDDWRVRPYETALKQI